MPNDLQNIQKNMLMVKNVDMETNVKININLV